MCDLTNPEAETHPTRFFLDCVAGFRVSMSPLSRRIRSERGYRVELASYPGKVASFSDDAFVSGRHFSLSCGVDAR
jgi:hypothetical protein